MKIILNFQFLWQEQMNYALQPNKLERIDNVSCFSFFFFGKLGFDQI